MASEWIRRSLTKQVKWSEYNRVIRGTYKHIFNKKDTQDHPGIL